MQEFSYEKFWDSEMTDKSWYKNRSNGHSVKLADIPVSPALTKLDESIRRLGNIYNFAELEEGGINIIQLLEVYTEMQLFEFLEMNNYEPSITVCEVEHLLFENEFDKLTKQKI